MTCQAIHNYGPVPIVPVVETSRSRGRMPAAPWLIAGLTPFCCSYLVTLNVDGAHKESHWHWYGEHFLQSVQTITRVQPATYSVGAEGFFPPRGFSDRGVKLSKHNLTSFMAWCVIKNSASLHFTFCWYGITLWDPVQSATVTGDNVYGATPIQKNHMQGKLGQIGIWAGTGDTNC